jgi:hypothetical protein
MHYLRQWNFLSKIKELGGIAFLADSIERCRQEFNEQG